MSSNYVSWKNEIGVELYIDRRKGCDDENKAKFNSLFTHKEETEEAFCEPLEWERLDNKWAPQTRKTLQKGGWKDP